MSRKWIVIGMGAAVVLAVVLVANRQRETPRSQSSLIVTRNGTLKFESKDSDQLTIFARYPLSGSNKTTAPKNP